MKIIVGLGNPGEKYKHTRHNVGWLALDWLIETLGGKVENFRLEKHLNAQLLDLTDTDRVLWVKPQTFMNASGEPVKQLCDFYKLNPHTDVLILHDEIDLPLGKVKFTGSASSAGHNGVADIINHLGTQDFHRLRIGVETRLTKTELPTEVFVLQNFTNEELQKLTSDIFPNIKSITETFIHN